MATSRTRRKGNGQFNGSTGAGANAPTAAPPVSPTAAPTSSVGSRPTFGGGTCTRYTDEVVDGARKLCGQPVTDGDWCRACPGYKNSKPSAARPTAAPAGEGEVVPADQVVRCSGEVTDARTGESRQCKNAVRAPESRCHDHGGDIDASLFKTFAKAQAEAQRGELTAPTATERAGNPDAARAEMERDLLALMQADPSAFLRMSEEMSRWNRQHSIARFSPGNQLSVMAWAYHAEKQKDPDANPDDLFARAMTRVKQPMHTRKGWEDLGREVNRDALAVPVAFYSPGRTTSTTVTDEKTGEEETVTRPGGPRWGSRTQYFADDTTGEPLPDEPLDPLDRPLPPGHGDVDAYRSWLTEQAAAIGVDVVVDAHAPESGAKAYYSPGEKRIHLWAGHADGDAATQAHVLAHELGHALDPKLNHSAYGRRGCNERGRAEVFAESFAYLMTARHGFDSTETTAGYSAGWARALGGLGSKEAASVMRDALTVAHGLLYPNDNEGE